jgi:hypothetical protein
MSAQAVLAARARSWEGSLEQLADAYTRALGVGGQQERRAA